MSSVAAWFEAHSRQMATDLVELCEQNSGSRNLPGLYRVSEWIETWMDFQEAKFQRLALPTRQVVSPTGAIEFEATGDALRWDFQPESSKRVLLAIHYDTVFGVDSPFQSCEWLTDDQLRGPGVADAKGGIVVLRYALKALAELSLHSDLGWTVLLNPDEELGSPSSAGLLQKLAGEFDFGLVFEPALPSGALVAQRKGSGNFDIVVRGKSAHAGRHFEEGRNAIALLSQIFVQLDQLNGERDGATINLGQVQGGGPVNVVPDLAVGRLNARLVDRESVLWFEGELEKIVKNAKSMEGFQVEIYGGITSPPKMIDEAVKSLMRAVELATACGRQSPVVWTNTGGVCDGNRLAAAGLPNIDTLGPVGDGLHSLDEWVQVGSLPQKAQVIVNLLSRYAAGEFPELNRLSTP